MAARSTATTAAPSVEVNGFAVRAIRVLTGITPADLAAAIDADRSYIYLIEAGRRQRMSVGKFEALRLALGVADRRALLAFPHLPETVAA